ncbi:Ornithine aminotransferase [Anoxybacillus sp. BCO1]|nr:Ornithine aminotransferase [Anoxybacillus sp. BCO1]
MLRHAHIVKTTTRRLLCKETHDTVIRFAPPLVITKEELDWAIEKVKKVFEQ